MKTVFASTPLRMAFPEEMGWSVREVLRGEYDAGYDGHDLDIIDLGANVGAFTMWANLRWPGSRIHAWEPHPGTFRMLKTNVAELANVTCHNAGVLPSNTSEAAFFSKYDGDGESGFVSHIGSALAHIPPEHTFDVRVCSPSDLPPCDVLKIDVEGAEADILENMALNNISLIVLEFDNDQNRRRIKTLLADRFVLEYEHEVPWSLLMRRRTYRPELRGDHFGHLFFSNRTRNKLLKRQDWNESRESPLDARSFPARKLLAALPTAIYRDLRARLEA